MNHIKTYRERNGMTQKRLAMDIGVSQQAVDKWENNKAQPRSDKLSALARALNCTVGELLAEEGE